MTGKEEPSDNEPWKRAENWQQAAIAVAIITPTLALFTLPWIFDAKGDQEMLFRVQIVGAGVAVGLAFITFCTVVWRGLISTEQARLQRLQIDKLSEQIAATGESNLADLLQRGAELLAETSKPAHVAAGIAILRSVAVSRTGLFAIEAMDMMADFAQAEFARNRDSLAFASAVAVLAEGEDVGRRSNRRLRLSRPDKHDQTWKTPLRGVVHVSYVGGECGPTFLKAVAGYATSYAFVSIVIRDADVDVGIQYSTCIFKGCRIRSVTFGSDHKFENCEFTGCEIDSADSIQAISILDNNWYDAGLPPICSEKVDWSEHFRVSTYEEELPF